MHVISNALPRMASLDAALVMAPSRGMGIVVGCFIMGDGARRATNLPAFPGHCILLPKLLQQSS